MDKAIWGMLLAIFIILISISTTCNKKLTNIYNKLDSIETLFIKYNEIKK